MTLEKLVVDEPINFADLVPTVKEIMLDAFDKIMEYEGATAGNPEDYAVHYASDEPNNTFGGAFIITKYGSYILHDLREEQKVWYEGDDFECTILFYSLTKISDN